MDTIKFYYERILRSAGTCNVQISGGEPTMREDLNEVIKLGHGMGFEFIQLNTNGIKLANYEYVEELKDAGLNSVFLQFDGMDRDICLSLRGKDILKYKLKAIENLKKVRIGTILVCTVVPGINDLDLYNIVDYGIKHMPAIRGVHFQPVSYFGRIPKIPKDEDRITLPEIMYNLSKQSNGMLKLGDFKPPGCENAYCSFNANYIVLDGKLVALGPGITKPQKITEIGEVGATKAKSFVKKNWVISQRKFNEDKYASFNKLLKRIETNHFSISAMAFQDAWNVDINRLKDCCIHTVSRKGNIIPFCAYNITNIEGKSLYRL